MPTKNALYQRHRALILRVQRRCKTCTDRLDRDGPRCTACLFKEKISRSQKRNKKPQGICPVNSCPHPSTKSSKTCEHHRRMNQIACVNHRKKKRKLRESSNG